MTHAEVCMSWAENTDMRKRVRCGRISFNGRAAMSHRFVVASKFPDLCGDGETLCVAIGNPIRRIYAYDTLGNCTFLGSCGFVTALQSLGRVRTVTLPMFFLNAFYPELACTDIVSYDGLTRCISVMDALAHRYERRVTHSRAFSRGDVVNLLNLIACRNELCRAIGESEKPETYFSPDIASVVRRVFPGGPFVESGGYYDTLGGASSVAYYSEHELIH